MTFFELFVFYSKCDVWSMPWPASTLDGNPGLHFWFLPERELKWLLSQPKPLLRQLSCCCQLINNSYMVILAGKFANWTKTSNWKVAFGSSVTFFLRAQLCSSSFFFSLSLFCLANYSFAFIDLHAWANNWFTIAFQSIFTRLWTCKRGCFMAKC